MRSLKDTDFEAKEGRAYPTILSRRLLNTAAMRSIFILNRFPIEIISLEEYHDKKEYFNGLTAREIIQDSLTHFKEEQANKRKK